MEDNSKEEIKSSLEEQLEKSNSEATRLIQELESKKVEYSELLEDLNTQKEDISSILSEINTDKQTFIDDINKKLEEYSEKFTEVNSEIDTLKSDTKETFKTLDSEYNELINKYKTDADEKMEEMTSKVDEMSTKLDDENDKFDKFITDNKAAYEQQYTEIKELVSKYRTSTADSIDNIATREKSIVASQAKIEKIEADLQVLKDSIDEYTENMSDKTKEIDEKIKKFSTETQSIIEKNTIQTEEIGRQLELATGAGLFSSFDKRRKDLEIGQWVWLGVLILSITMLIIFSIWLTCQFKQIDWQNVNWFIDVILKASVSMPILYLVAFVTDRYTKERRLLEEYAFKSTISLALKPYFDMVASNNITDDERQFLIRSIENVFSTPTDKVYRTKECQNKIDIAHLTELTENVRQLENKIEGNK